MSMPALRTLPAARRTRVLQALGIAPWRLRVAERSPAEAAALEPVQASTATCVVVLPGRCATRELDLLGRALTAYGVDLARAARVGVDDGKVSGLLPRVRAYLVFGEAQARALGRELPAEVMQQAQIVLADEPQQILATASGKRRLWLAMRQLRRTLARRAG